MGPSEIILFVMITTGVAGITYNLFKYGHLDVGETRTETYPHGSPGDAAASNDNNTQPV